MPEADKIYGKFLPETIDPPERVCFVIEIPDTLQYRAALMGQLEWLADWRCWEHTQYDYTNPPARNLEAAQLFAIAVTEGEFDECGDMSCDDVADCIENDDNVQSALLGVVGERSTGGNVYPYGQSLPPGALSRDLTSASNPTCDLDILWAQCLGVVEFTATAINDGLQKIEVSTNVVELVNGLIDAIPVMATVKQTIGVSGVLDTLNYFQEAVLEGFSAQYTETPGGVRDQIACSLFCKCKVDCVITLNRILEVMDERLSVYFAPPSIGGFTDLISTIGGFNVDTTSVVDATFWVAWKFVEFGNFIFGNKFDDMLDIVLVLKSDEPSNDWITLCDDCPVETCLTYDRDNPAGWTFSDNGEATAPDWRLANAGTNLEGHLTGLSLTGYESVTFQFNLLPFAVVGYSYIRVITNVGTHNYSGSFTGGIGDAQAIITGLAGETINTIEYLITGGSSSDSYRITFVELCP